MTAQVSDVAVRSSVLRRTVLAHGVASFFYNTVILALSINAAVAIAERLKSARCGFHRRQNRLSSAAKQDAGRMAKTINYRQLMKKAMHGFVADVLAQVARDGLPGKHYFFITFDTTHPGVDMNAALRARYPTEMTIVLQEWFADLAVMKDRFTVTLNFGNIPEPIVVPFEAMKTFVDPSVEFGVKFDAHEEEGDPAPPPRTRPVVALADRRRPRIRPSRPRARSSASTSSASTEPSRP